jgi:hypothetical protein
LGDEVYCKNCGYENDDDASFCENCGAFLSPYSSSKPSGMSSTNKILIVAVIVLILGVGIAAGVLLTSKAPVNNTTANVTNPVTTTNSSTNPVVPILIDSGNISGDNLWGGRGSFTYSWETYQNTENNLVIYSKFINPSSTVDNTNNQPDKTLKQTSSLTLSEVGFVLITVEPKASGKSSYASKTSLQGYSTVVDYYWNYFKPNVLMKGPID